MKLPGLLLVISGPSGTGKGTVCRALVEKHPSIVYSVSATTRPPRTGEVDGVNYFFLGEEEFLQKVKEGGFVEWAKVYGNYYGTPKDALLANLAAGKDVILEIDIQGAMQVKEKFPKGVFIFIMPPSLKELQKRICTRGTDSAEVIAKRMNSAAGEMKSYSNYDYIVVNERVGEAVAAIEAIIFAEKHRASRYQCIESPDQDNEILFIAEQYQK
ncbi:guanylate kinase [Thermincola potens]|uniref:Guanylate kinase n=1 Tax=Thermincola potens (strain JR) TaxID=635013 RepID=D5X7T8_THEPJ|nr:guanylate kinase [Thermincola potens]ADG82658.1 guanylate kinase [Thermincola potens JR]